MILVVSENEDLTVNASKPEDVAKNGQFDG
jgi:hypothetical protein